MKKEDWERIESIARKLDVPQDELRRNMMGRPEVDHDAAMSGRRSPIAKGISIRAHKLFWWLIPASVLIVVMPVSVIVTRCFFPNATNVVLVCGPLLAVVGLYVLHSMRIACPQCGAVVSFRSKVHSSMARYVCKQCGFRAR